jgi:hypothetical protein
MPPLPDAAKRDTRALMFAIECDKLRRAREADIGCTYLEAMPPLCGHENICEFIACLAHGMLIHVIEGAESTRLLYAAQVVHSTVKSTPKNSSKSR